MVSAEQVLDALRFVKDPEIGRDIVSLNMVQDLKCGAGKVSFTYILTTPACPMKDQMEKEAKEALLKLDGVREVEIKMSSNVARDVRLDQVLPEGVKNVIAVGSGKGGVGKSTVACNIAVALAMEGSKVGLMDTDVYGPNQPQMLGLMDKTVTTDAEGKIIPPEKYGVKLMSMGFLIDGDTPVVWRGPMLHGVVTQFFRDVRWGDIDYLIVDLPPGTGDVQLTLCQSVPLLGAVIVTTPQSIALSDVKKAVAMFQKLRVSILGVVENMSGFFCPHCGRESRIFSSGGGNSLVQKYETQLLGQIPVHADVCDTGECGKPIVFSMPEHPVSRAFRETARKIAAQVSLANVRAGQKPKTITIQKV